MLTPKPGLFNFRQPAPDPTPAASSNLPRPDLSFADKVLAKLGLISAAEAGADPNAPEGSRIRQTMRQAGYYAAGNHKGTTHGLEVNLTRILSNLREEFSHNHKEQETARKQKQAEINTVDTEISFKQDERATLDKRAEAKKAYIGELKQEIHTLRSHPEDMHLPEPSRLTLWISRAILVLLTVYLFVFYSSAIYSAFYKQFDPAVMAQSNVVIRAIFDARAIPNAFHDGITELILIVTLPSAFLGLGYLIHKFLEHKHWTKYLKVAALLLITFIFDCILAYGISKNIYEFDRARDITGNIPPYSLSVAVNQVEVWAVLFSGFIVYLIWGFVFDYFVEANRLNNKVAAAITERQANIADAEAEIQGWEAAIGKIREAVMALQTRKHHLEAQLLGVIIPAREWHNYLMEFTGGWLEWMTGAQLSQTKQAQCKQTLDEFVERHLGQETVLSYRPTGLDNLPLEGQTIFAN